MLVTCSARLVIPLTRCEPRPYEHERFAPEKKKSHASPYDSKNRTVYARLKFGPVPFGSVLSYQCPLEISRDIIKHAPAPEFPQLPVEGYNFKFHYNFQSNYK